MSQHNVKLRVVYSQCEIKEVLEKLLQIFLPRKDRSSLVSSMSSGLQKWFKCLGSDKFCLRENADISVDTRPFPLKLKNFAYLFSLSVKKEPDPIEHRAVKDLIFCKGILHPLCYQT